MIDQAREWDEDVVAARVESLRRQHAQDVLAGRIAATVLALFLLALGVMAIAVAGCGNQAKIADESNAAYTKGSAAYAAMPGEVQRLVDAMVARRTACRQAHAAAVTHGDWTAAQQAVADFDGLFADLEKLVAAVNGGTGVTRDLLASLATVNRLAKDDTALAGPLNIVAAAVGIPPLVAVPTATPPLPPVPYVPPVTVPPPPEGGSWTTPAGVLAGVGALAAAVGVYRGGKATVQAGATAVTNWRAKRKAHRYAKAQAAVDAQAEAAKQIARAVLAATPAAPAEPAPAASDKPDKSEGNGHDVAAVAAVARKVSVRAQSVPVPAN